MTLFGVERAVVDFLAVGDFLADAFVAVGFFAAVGLFVAGPVVVLRAVGFADLPFAVLPVVAAGLAVEGLRVADALVVDVFLAAEGFVVGRLAVTSLVASGGVGAIAVAVTGRFCSWASRRASIGS